MGSSLLSVPRLRRPKKPRPQTSEKLRSPEHLHDELEHLSSDHA